MKLLPRSITGNLILGILTAAALVLVAAAAALDREVSDLLVGAVDRTLHSKRQIVTGLLHEEHGGIEFELSDIVAGDYAIPRSGHYYRVMIGDRVLAASPSLVNDRFAFIPSDRSVPGKSSREHSFTSIGPDDEPVRVLRFQYAAFGRDFDITLAESLVDSRTMAATFRRFLLLSVPLTLLFLCFTAWLIARRALLPLASFSTTVETITHKNLAGRIDVGSTSRELTLLAQSFNAMLDRLSAVFEGQKRLVADASHELKTPLSVIRTNCDVLLQRARTPEDYVDGVREIQSTSRGMAKLINDLLSLAKLDAGLVSSADFAPVVLEECVRETMRLVTPLATEKQVSLQIVVAGDIRVTGSRPALAEAFLNLIENAVRYNVPQGSITVSVGSEGGNAFICVSDTGVGMSRDESERIFERFYRADSARSTEGTGLGLSIVRAIVEAHGGGISVLSEPGRGSTFRIAIPLLIDTGNPA